MKYKYAVVGVVLTAALAGGIFYVRKSQPVSKLSASQTDSAKSQGPQNAPIEMIEYSDFQCPACQRAETTVKKILETYPGKIHFTFRHYPLPGHRWSAVAHQAAECAAVKGKFWEFHDRLYSNQQIWSQVPNAVEFFFQYAGEIGLNLEPFAACLTDPNVAKGVLRDKRSGDGLQINSTPTFFINQQRLVGPVELEQKGDELIRKILGMSSPAAPPPAKSPETVPVPAPPA